MKDAPTANDESTPNTASYTRTAAWLIPAMILASVAAGMAGEFVLGSVQRLYYPPPHDQMGDPPWYTAAVVKSMMINDSIGFAVLGAILFGLLGCLLGLAKSFAKSVAGLLVGALSGALAGAAAGPVSYYLQSTTATNTNIDGIVKTILVWAPLYACFGLVGAFLAVCVGPALGWGKSLLMGIVSAAVVLLAFTLGATTVFPVGHANFLYPEHDGIRYLAMASLGLVGSAAAALAILQARKSPSAADQPADV